MIEHIHSDLLKLKTYCPFPKNETEKHPEKFMFILLSDFVFSSLLLLIVTTVKVLSYIC